MPRGDPAAIPASTERNYPVRISRYSLISDSEGAGNYRGGLGLRRDYLFEQGGVSFTILADRTRSGPWGLQGGEDGLPARYVLNPDGEAVELDSKVTLQLKPGDVVSIQTCGGGGYGSPSERDPEAVLLDLRAGNISAERALNVYGVVVDEFGLVIDEAATKELRARGMFG